MIVVLIIGLLIGMAVKNMRASVDQASGVRVMGDLEGYKTDLLMYQMQNGSLPTTAQGLKALTTRPESDPRPRNWRKVIDEQRVDAWQNEYFYERPGKHNTTGFDIYSAGPDGKPNTPDDIGNWSSTTP